MAIPVLGVTCIYLWSCWYWGYGICAPHPEIDGQDTACASARESLLKDVDLEKGYGAMEKMEYTVGH